VSGTVRPLEYASESQELVEVLQKNLPYLPHGLLFEWLYLRNPEGQARTWVAIDPGSRRIVGVAAAFPRLVYRNGAESRGYVLGDFCIDAGHRSLGLAVTLQRACLEGLAAEGADFAFDFPSVNMLAVYKRLRIEANATLIRYAKPIRADRKIAQKVPVPALARGLGIVANATLRLRDTGFHRSGGWTISVEAGPWGEEFTSATRAWSGNSTTLVARTAKYLNWRFAGHPLQRYELVTARLKGALHGYLIHHSNGEDCTIDDLVAVDDGVRRALLTETVALVRERGIHTLSAPWLCSHRGTKLLEKGGFRPRESSPVVLLPLQHASERPIGTTEDDWQLTNGDWES
jgi:hypothetical protein